MEDINATVLGHPGALFDAGVLHIAVAGGAGRWRLLFGFIELLPAEIPPPLNVRPTAGPRLRKSNLRTYAAHVPMSAARARRWYDDARAGRIVCPVTGTMADADDASAPCCDPLTWAEEPVWPGYVIGRDEGERLPFLSQWHATPRMHHLIATASSWDYTEAESALIDDFVEAEMGLLRRAWPRLAESLHLIVPNPYYRELDEELARLPGGEGVRVSVEPRRGIAQPELEIELTDHRPTGIAEPVRSTIGASPIDIPLGVALRETSAVVRGAGGVLEIRSPAPFLRHMEMNLDFVVARRRVEVDGRGDRPSTSFEVPVTMPFRSEIGDPIVVDGAAALHSMTSEIAIRDMARSLEQRWFSDQREEAHAFVQELVGRAREQVLVADPYLAIHEVQQVGLAVHLRGVPIRLLTTREGLDKGGVHPVDIVKNLARWRAQDAHIGAITLRVMGDRVLHDRFLRVDDRLYTLGNSLNSLGDKAGLVLRVPNATPVFAELERIWASAEPIDEVAKTWKRTEKSACPTTNVSASTSASTGRHSYVCSRLWRRLRVALPRWMRFTS